MQLAALFFGAALLCGCSLTAAHKHATALSTAVTPVIDQSAAAYREVQAVHDLRSEYEAVVAYQAKDAAYNPRNVPLLLSEKDIQVRLATLAALQMYSQSLIQITNGTDSAALDDASKSIGDNLKNLGNNLAPTVDNVLSLASAPTLSPGARNGISTGVDALGQFLVSRKIAKELPGRIEQMDPIVQTLCKTLSDDAHVLAAIETRDYDRILNLEKQFILEDEQPGSRTNAWEKRAEIMQLSDTARRQREADGRFIALEQAINNLALTHHALAAEVQGNNPASLKDKLSQLAGVGKNLGKFYSSLPSN